MKAASPSAPQKTEAKNPDLRSRIVPDPCVVLLAYPSKIREGRAFYREPIVVSIATRGRQRKLCPCVLVTFSLIAHKDEFVVACCVSSDDFAMQVVSHVGMGRGAG
jgi:hypothetical protein